MAEAKRRLIQTSVRFGTKKHKKNCIKEIFLLMFLHISLFFCNFAPLL